MRVTYVNRDISDRRIVRLASFWVVATSVMAVMPTVGYPESPPNTRIAAMGLEERFFQALVSADLPALDALSDPDLVYSHGDAHTDTKPEMMDRMRSGVAKFLRIERPSGPSGPHDREVVVIVNPQTIVITGKVTFLVSMHSGPPEETRDRLTTVWAKRNATWRLVLWQATPFPERPK